MHLFAGSSHPALAASIAKELGIALGKVDLKEFSCGERYIRFQQSVRGKNVYIVQTAAPNINEHLIELLLMCQAAKLSFAKSVHVMTLNLHSPQIQGFFSIPADALDSGRIFADYFRKKKLKDILVIAPDIGSAKYTKIFADMMGADIAILHKSRPEHHKAEILDVVGEVQGKTCIIYDDMIDTAGTLLTAKQALIERGAKKDVYAAATHAIFSGPAIERLTAAGFKEVIVTDSMPVRKNAFPGLTVLSVAPLIAEVIQHIEHDESVTEIYEKKRK
ncbi:MAG: ribose-phosphate pyrophosphokinase [Candidatus Peregrinibacteria bacterium GW2011_GWA2_54_9]|nr:MAG: ribose-phosphate pyrophosphokinase [Candidatus Peregrinibacteria bacterium GW2011_GWA2_54_9]